MKAAKATTVGESGTNDSNSPVDVMVTPKDNPRLYLSGPKKMKKRSAFMLAGAALVAASETNAMGIGGSVQGNTATIYIPFQVGNALIEPFAAYGRLSTMQEGSSSTQDTSRIGAGYFLRSAISDTASVYYGTRLFWGHSAWKSTNGYTVAAPTSSAYTVYSTQYSSDGYGISPVLGAEYKVSPHLGVSLEGEVGYSF